MNYKFVYSYTYAGFRPRLRGTNLKPNQERLQPFSEQSFRPRLRGTNLKPDSTVTKVFGNYDKFPSPITGN